MTPFLHQRLRELDRLLESSDAALRACTERDLALLDVVRAHLDDAGATYGRLGLPDAQNHLLLLTAQLAEARDGVDPVTRERVTVRRRELQRTVSLHALMESSERLRADYAGTRHLLEQLRERMAPLAVYALQQSMVPTSSGDLSQSELDVVWKALCDDAGSRSAARQMAVGASAADVVLVLGALLAAAG